MISIVTGEQYGRYLTKSLPLRSRHTSTRIKLLTRSLAAPAAGRSQRRGRAARDTTPKIKTLGHIRMEFKDESYATTPPARRCILKYVAPKTE
ncbi:hypothetical protein EVAR_99370_1 [Eumeta japonica]|uniref:Uncharacterized protein n=1 Tax=Eumeta variegata TaxID=151549 RepID=A0A4C1YS05_EUMVA|nr:hypothetical protein EVAR_99370_1 [Eumeta japonica]